MPNIVIDYSKTLDARINIESLLDALHESALATGIFQRSAIKVYARPFTYARTAGEKAEFLQVCVHMFEGRSTEQKAALSDALFAALDKACPTDIEIAVEITDIEKASYRKRTL
ncbi:5-carboxymethyl-2-hydroxymuconate Delta-isomerase [Phytohalomonas tamaricis]|uniref:5-carboxymethyl-2-hydroxymuconate Delta-isomerase n=1 Tax=Phytohalomonas tamaricis TaxID=2081032 RepID=UPI000D0B78D8|nr:5-carboxymethyl-2-hydroxymuconate Delta-isomerase [Phytohalomonas tamaricis]